MRLLVTLALLASLSSCKEEPRTLDTQQGVQLQSGKAITLDQAAVVSAHELASAAGAQVLADGGNAFDAAVATEFALAAVYPQAGNIGGGGFIVFRQASGDTGSLDYRERAPAAATTDMYLDKDGNVIPGLSQRGALAVGVPGTVAGMHQLYETHGSGKLSWERLLQPAIELARVHVLSEQQARVLNSARDAFVEVNGSRSINPYVADSEWKAGDSLRNAQLATTLRRISSEGPDGFYRGDIARATVGRVQQDAGVMTLEDLANYKAVYREPVQWSYRGYDLTSMGPPSSGGITLAQITTMLTEVPLNELGHNTTEAIAATVEAYRRAYADRNHYLGDPDYVDIPTQQLLDSQYLTDRYADVTEQATRSADIAKGVLTNRVESDETTHYSIIAPDGTAVSATTTLNSYFGSKVYVPSAGYFLNNEMDDFSAKPGVPNQFGLVGAEANAIAPGKRMLSSMTPTLVEKDGELFMVVGTPGGSTIITSVFQTISNVLDHGMSMQEAVDAPRFHHQWLPDAIMLEPKGFNDELQTALQERDYIIREEFAPVIGKVNAILVRDDKLQAAGDRRGDDYAVGF